MRRNIPGHRNIRHKAVSTKTQHIGSRADKSLVFDMPGSPATSGPIGLLYRLLPVRNRLRRVTDVAQRPLAAFGLCKPRRVIGMGIQPSGFRLHRRPAVIGLPLIRARLETSGLRKIAGPLPLQPIIEPTLLQVLEPGRGIAFKRDLTQAVSSIPPPLTMKPGSKHNKITVKAVRLFLVRIHDLRSLVVFLFKITTHEKEGGV